MKLLILTFYFRPDLSAGSFRSTALVKALLEARPDIELEIVTTLPNRYKSYSADAPAMERDDRVTIHRIQLPAHRSGMTDQARSFLTFLREARRLTAKGGYDLIYATSGRLMTAVLAAQLSRRLKVPLYLDIRDIFVDTIKDVLPRFAPVAKTVFAWIERRAIEQAKSINLVSRGFAPYFSERYPKSRFTFFTNGVDDEFLGMEIPEPAPGNSLTVLYAGNIGEGQGLHTILPALAKLTPENVRFRVFGDGGRRAQLESSLAQSGVENVDILPPVPRARLLEEYASADVLFLHLNDYEAFHKVLPSKLFEYAATGKPIWAGIAGYPREFSASEIDNVALFAPGNAVEAAASFTTLRMGPTDRSAFIAKYSRRMIMQEMASDILAFTDAADRH